MSLSSIYGCFVLYNPDDIHHLDSVEAVLKAGGRVVVFDNSDENLVRQDNRRILDSRFPGAVVFMEDGGNIGLSAAFNKISNFVLQNADAEAIVLFDQDSTVSSDFFSSLVHGFRSVKKKFKIGVYAAYAKRVSGPEYGVRIVDWVKGLPSNLMAVKFAPSSFSLIPVEALREVGLFQDDFFIDHIDVDFSYRCWKLNRIVVIDKELRFPHRIGHGDALIFGKLLMPISAPFRHYYQARNNILSARRGGAPVLDTFRTVMGKILKVSLLGLHAGAFWTRLGFCLRGVMDGVRGRSGRLR